MRELSRSRPSAANALSVSLFLSSSASRGVLRVEAWLVEGAGGVGLGLAADWEEKKLEMDCCLGATLLVTEFLGVGIVVHGRILLLDASLENRWNSDARESRPDEDGSH